ncbi:MAG: zf-HC2 domain-containing protein, partial [Deltaproteobacteria bacterium]|nr:zf-HC2 domain-containing protein [Deltaproteobacteria bacterium]
MSGTACIEQPVSWLALERFHLGELPEPQRAAVADHLRACP